VSHPSAKNALGWGTHFLVVTTFLVAPSFLVVATRTGLYTQNPELGSEVSYASSVAYFMRLAAKDVFEKCTE
jgi:hypothetical protein